MSERNWHEIAPESWDDDYRNLWMRLHETQDRLIAERRRRKEVEARIADLEAAEPDWFQNAASDLHDVCLNTPMGECPSWGAIYDVLREAAPPAAEEGRTRTEVWKKAESLIWRQAAGHLIVNTDKSHEEIAHTYLKRARDAQESDND